MDQKSHWQPDLPVGAFLCQSQIDTGARARNELTAQIGTTPQISHLHLHSYLPRLLQGLCVHKYIVGRGEKENIGKIVVNKYSLKYTYSEIYIFSKNIYIF